MGGHAAWRKRVARGELAKGLGGAIMRHRPHRGRKGKDLILNRKGHIGGGNPKKKKKDLGVTQSITMDKTQPYKKNVLLILLGTTIAYLASYCFFLYSEYCKN